MCHLYVIEEHFIRNFIKCDVFMMLYYDIMKLEM